MVQNNVIIICIVHKISASLKITRISKSFSRSMIDFYFLKKVIFLQQIMMEIPSLEEENIIKDVRNVLD